MLTAQLSDVTGLANLLKSVNITTVSGSHPLARNMGPDLMRSPTACRGYRLRVGARDRHRAQSHIAGTRLPLLAHV